jgi:hypothetical protein
MEYGKDGKMEEWKSACLPSICADRVRIKRLRLRKSATTQAQVLNEGREEWRDGKLEK